jgi:hypothetical protein
VSNGYVGNAICYRVLKGALLNVVIPPSGTAIATSVWGAATRTLSSITNVLPAANAVNTGLAASASVQPFPGGAIVSLQCFGVHASAAGTMTVNLIDGTSVAVIATAAAGTVAYAGPVISEIGVNVQIKNNDAVNSATYYYSSVNTQ